MQKIWIRREGALLFSQQPAVYNKLPVGVYELNFDPQRQEFFLLDVAASFDLPDPCYGTEKTLVSKVMKVFGSSTSNLGVLLSGVKGTGKSVTAKVICHQLDLPVILINQPFVNFGGFLSAIEQELVVLFDEFEKIYSFYDESDGDGNKVVNIGALMSTMDGVMSSGYKRLFLFTTNHSYLPDVLFSRPSRIRYHKEFGNLGQAAIMEIIERELENKDHVEALISYLKKLEIITVDIVRVCIDEVNLHDACTDASMEFLNLKQGREKSFDLEKKTKDGFETVHTGLTLDYQEYMDYAEHEDALKGWQVYKKTGSGLKTAFGKVETSILTDGFLWITIEKHKEKYRVSPNEYSHKSLRNVELAF